MSELGVPARCWVYQAEPGRWAWMLFKRLDRPTAFAADFNSHHDALEDFERSGFADEASITIDPFHHLRVERAL